MKRSRIMLWVLLGLLIIFGLAKTIFAKLVIGA